jgi:hypothetical protein
MCTAAREENLVGAKLDLRMRRRFARRRHRRMTVGAECRRVAANGRQSHNSGQGANYLEDLVSKFGKKIAAKRARQVVTNLSPFIGV